MIHRRVAALPPSQGLTGPPSGDEPRVLKGRRGGTDELLGRGGPLPQSPCLLGQGGRPLDKCLVQLHADATIRKSLAAVREAVNSSPVVTPRENKKLPPSVVRTVDRRGHITPVPPRRPRQPVNGRGRGCLARGTTCRLSWSDRRGSVAVQPTGAACPSYNLAREVAALSLVTRNGACRCVDPVGETA